MSRGNRSDGQIAADRIGRLQKRADHLARRIAESSRELSYDKAELSALLWAIPILEDYTREWTRDPRATHERYSDPV